LQEEDISRIADTAVFTTENIIGGNEEIREVSWILRNQLFSRSGFFYVI